MVNSMSGRSDCYLIRQKSGALVKFGYEERYGIYWQEFEDGQWSDRKTVYRDGYGYFCVLVDEQQRVYIFCQDICGYVILCTWQKDRLEVKTLFNINRNIIMPVYIRAFLCGGNIHLFYNMMDQYTNAEVLVQRMSRDGIKWDSPRIVTKFDRCNDIPYRIVRDDESRLHILKTSFTKRESPKDMAFEDQGKIGYQLISQTYYAADNSWSCEEVVHGSSFSYKDYTLLVKDNVIHYLFVVQEKELDKVVYKNKYLGLGDETVLFTGEDIDSCLLMIYEEKLWALWACSDGIYGCFSDDGGRSFSHPRLYERCKGCVPQKVFYQGCFERGIDDPIGNKLYTCELYELSSNGQESFFLDGELKSPLALLDIKGGYGESVNGFQDDVERLWELLKDICRVFETMEGERGRLQAQLKDVKDELVKLNKIAQIAVEEVSSAKSQFQTAMEELKLYMKGNERLKNMCNYLEQKILAYEESKKLLEKRMAEQYEMNENLRQELEIIKRLITPAIATHSKVARNGIAVAKGEDNANDERNGIALGKRQNGGKLGLSLLKLLSK